MPATYMTRQQQAVLSCVEDCPAGCTATQLTELLHSRGETVGLTTVYRQLEKLVQQGLVHKVVTQEGARYQFCRSHGAGEACLLIQCEKCGRMEHVACRELQQLYRHLQQEHQFRIDPRRTVFYGLCRRCSGEETP